MEDEGHIKSMVADIEEKLHQLSVFNGKNEIDCYCDSLEAQIILAVESSINDLNNLQEELLEKVRSYRFRRQKSLAEQNSQVQKATAEKIQQLQIEISQFQARVQAELSQSLTTGQNSMETVRSKSDDLMLKLNVLEKQMRRDAFDYKFLRFIQYQTFALNKNLIVKFRYFDHDLEMRNSKLNSLFKWFIF